NEEILRCDFVVAIPASRKYPALNMSHAATIMMYALHQRLGKDRIDSHINAISKKEKEQILKMVDSILDKMSFRRQDEKETQRKVWRRMISKSFMSKREAFALMGFLRKLM
ncbi:MAG: hypothetical protein KJ574_04230, partial [Nanoarchaeota archaeon]|nr:hypothetical protein [Nanoarchaeota archaeon]